MNVENKMESSTTAPQADNKEYSNYEEGAEGASYDIYESSGDYDDEDFSNAVSFCDGQGLWERPTEWMSCLQSQINISPFYAVQVAVNYFCDLKSYNYDNVAWISCISQVGGFEMMSPFAEKGFLGQFKNPFQRLQEQVLNKLQLLWVSIIFMKIIIHGMIRLRIRK